MSSSNPQWPLPCLTHRAWPTRCVPGLSSPGYSGYSIPVHFLDCPSPQIKGAVTVSDKGGESKFTCTQDFFGSGLASLREWEGLLGPGAPGPGNQLGTKWVSPPLF